MGDLLSETFNNTESGNKFDDNSNPEPLISEEEMDVISSGNESGAEIISIDMLEDIHDRSQSHPSINRKEACCKICYFIKRGQV